MYTARNQDCRRPAPFFLQPFDEVQTVHTGHVLVDYQTARGAPAAIGKEIGSRVIGAHIEAEGFEQQLQ